MPKNKRANSRRPTTAPAQLSPQQSSKAWRWIQLILLTGLLACVVFFVTFRPISDPDTWFHMALGKWVGERHSIPRVDPFAGSSPGREWISSGWLASIFMERLFKTFGESGVGLLLMSFATILLAYALVLWSARKWFDDRGFIIVPLLLSLGLACVRFNPRPDIFSHLMLAATLLILVLAERPSEAGRPHRPMYLYLLVPLFALWANLHAGVFIGVLVMLIYIVWNAQQAFHESAKWRYSRILPSGLTILAPIANPYGPRLWALAYKISSIPKVGWIMEWMPFFKSGFPMPTGAYVCGLLLLIIVLAVLAATRVPWWHWAVATLLVLLALLQRRQVGPAAIGLCVLLLPGLPKLSVATLRNRAAVLAAAAVLTITLCGAKVQGYLGGGREWPRRGIDCTSLPCVSTDFLSANRPPGKMFNSYAFGGYLLYFLGPETKVFIDGRLDVYDPQVYLDTLAIEENRISIEAMEKRYGVQTWVLSIDDAIGDPMHLASRLAARPDFALVHFDDQAAVFIKRSAETRSYIEQHEFKYANPWKLQPLRETASSVQSTAAIDEVQRALEQSMGSANTSALAAIVAAATGDQQAALQMLRNAAARDPNSRLTRLVGQQMRQP